MTRRADGKFASGTWRRPGEYGVYVNVTATNSTSSLFKFLGVNVLPRRANATTTELISADLSLAAGDAGALRLRLRDSANATVSGSSNGSDAVAVTLTHVSDGDAVLGTHVGTPQLGTLNSAPSTRHSRDRFNHASRVDG